MAVLSHPRSSRVMVLRQISRPSRDSAASFQSDLHPGKVCVAHKFTAMSFHFNWKAFAHEEGFQAQIRDLLTDALNRKRPSILEGQIRVLNLDWGAEAPTLEMLEIGDVATDRFRGIFKLDYTGSASITIATQVQANLLNVYAGTAPSKFVLPTFVGAPVSFTIPMHLSLSEIRLQGIVIVVFSKTKGLTLVFRNDPLQSIKVSSTFDTLPGIPTLLQTQIDSQIRGLFREELPGVLYRLSLRWTPAGREALEASPHPGTCSNASKRVTFAEVDQEQQVSLRNRLHVEAMFSSRRTLSLSTMNIPTAIGRPELHRLQLERANSQIQFLDRHSYERVHCHASHVASRSSHPRRRRVIHVRKQHHQDRESEADDSSEVSTSSTLSAASSSAAKSTVLPSAPPLVLDTKRLVAEPFVFRHSSPIRQRPQLGLKAALVPHSWDQYLHHPSTPAYDHDVPDELPPAYVA